MRRREKMGKRLIVRLTCIVILTLAIGFGVFTRSQPAHAASPSCSGTGCNNLDPIAAGCAGSVSTLGTDVNGSISLELRFSNTCHTIWARLHDTGTCLTATFPDEYLYLDAVSSVGFDRFQSGKLCSGAYGNMVYVPVGGVGQVYYGAHNYHTGDVDWLYVGKNIA
jgi:Protein of unknown function (DUF2690)